MFILLLASLIFNVLICIGFLIYESQWEYSTETVTEAVTVDQQQSEGGGDNIFQTGEYASYAVTAEGGGCLWQSKLSKSRVQNNSHEGFSQGCTPKALPLLREV